MRIFLALLLNLWQKKSCKSRSSKKAVFFMLSNSIFGNGFDFATFERSAVNIYASCFDIFIAHRWQQLRKFPKSQSLIFSWLSTSIYIFGTMHSGLKVGRVFFNFWNNPQWSEGWIWNLHFWNRANCTVVWKLNLKFTLLEKCTVVWKL